MTSRFGSGPIFEAAGGTQASAGKGPQPSPSRYCRRRKLAVAGRSEEGAQQGQQQEQVQARPAHQEDRRGRAPDRGMEARARQVDIRHPAQDSAALGRHAAAQGRNALGLPDMRHADSRHPGTEHARTRLASEGAKLEPRRRPEVPHSELRRGTRARRGRVPARRPCQSQVKCTQFKSANYESHRVQYRFSQNFTVWAEPSASHEQLPRVCWQAVCMPCCSAPM